LEVGRADEEEKEASSERKVGKKEKPEGLTTRRQTRCSFQVGGSTGQQEELVSFSVETKKHEGRLTVTFDVPTKNEKVRFAWM